MLVCGLRFVSKLGRQLMYEVPEMGFCVQSYNLGKASDNRDRPLVFVLFKKCLQSIANIRDVYEKKLFRKRSILCKFMNKCVKLDN